MPINPNISLQTQVADIGGLALKGAQMVQSNRQFEAQNQRANALLALKQQEEQRAQMEMDRKSILRDTAIKGQEFLNIQDPTKAVEFIDQNIQQGGKSSQAWMEVKNVYSRNPEQAKAMISGAIQQGRLEKLIPEIPTTKSPEKFTQESLRKFEQTGRESDLVPRESTLKPTTAEAAVDKAFAKDYTDWVTGGMDQVNKNLVQLKSVSDRLGSGKENLTGPVVGRTPDTIRAALNPASIEVRDAVQEVVQRNLREVLGAQFTEREGMKLIERAYNENLSEAENKRRVDRLITVIQKAAEAKQLAADYYEKNGTLKGFKGKRFTMSDVKEMYDEELKAMEKPKSSGEWKIEEVK